MSSLRNAVNRRVHRERDQLQDRKTRYGLLEKHKDYRLRAQDHNRKKAQLKSLRKKAEDRNEDEFYFGMLSRSGPATTLSSGSKRWDGTVAGDRGNKALDTSVVRLMKTQDVGYVRAMRNVATKEVRALEERVVALGADADADGAAEDDEEEGEDDDGMDFDFGDDDISGKKNKNKKPAPRKTVFADAEDEREDQIQRDAEQDDDDDDDGVEGGDGKKGDPEERRARQKRKLLEKLRRRLLGARKKQSALARAEHELEVQRAGMAKTATIGGVTKAGKKFKVRGRKK
ncbi:putative u3 snornp-associated protein utp11 [Rosellinia necatrix]|uniref:Putative u3 snornp-associated protein utp11 n=1 Tax=Rosellinia necatrix TaxID=77044 RepID=A0A1W2TSV7_ROSNE|nr:putative u3 snornp-associated protein utp11 [Rosellinia necatrix]